MPLGGDYAPSMHVRPDGAPCGSKNRLLYKPEWQIEHLDELLSGEVTAPSLLDAIRDGAERFDKRPIERASVEARRELTAPDALQLSGHGLRRPLGRPCSCLSCSGLGEVGGCDACGCATRTAQ